MRWIVETDISHQYGPVASGGHMVAKLIIQTAIWLAAQGAVLFVAAGTWRWPQGWLFLGEMAVTGLAVGLWLAWHDPGLLAERLAAPVQRDQDPRDRIFMATLMVLWIAWFAFMPIDAVRLRLSDIPAWAQILGALLILLSMYAFYLTFRENSFAAPVVKIQKDRGQTVVTTGPYRIVRHPMYAGAILYFLGTPLLLGSGYGLALAPVLVALLALRIPIEEQMLRDKLDGYNDYAARVRYRLIPGLW
jgi:protein-S-isoprenylcysteine O-methyltransferase Ste14